MRISLTAVATALAVSVVSARPQTDSLAGNFSLSAIPTEDALPTPGGSCPKLAPGPVSFNYLAGAFPAPVPTDLYAMEAIRQTMAVYAMAIDGRNWDALKKVFVSNVRTNYSDPFYEIKGLQPLVDALAPGLASFVSTQHLLGTQAIHICSPTTAVSVTYFQATHFFTPYTGVANPVGNDVVLIDRGQYQDTWAKQKDGTWKITNRNLVRMGPGTLDGGFPSSPDVSAFIFGP